jgi:predicted  nucleic acid-binding Zn-ribbon protein
MSKRSSNLKNLLEQKENIEEKIIKLQLQLKGIEKSIAKAQASQNNLTTEEE